MYFFSKVEKFGRGSQGKGMVAVSDGNSEHVAHACMKENRSFRRGKSNVRLLSI